jgi:hypothetical protein
VRALAKAGLAWRPGNWRLGVTLTTPGVKLWGNGKVVYNASVTGAVTTPTVSASKQTGLDSAYHSPFSIAGGATWESGGTAIHSTVEWFSSVDPYLILEPEPAPVSGRPETIPLLYTGEAASVANFGVGLEQRLTDRLVLYAGVARNASAYVAARDSFAAWDLTDVTFGFSFEKGRGTFAFGAGYAWGSGQIPGAFEEPGQPAPASLVLLDADFSRWTLSFGASFK